MHTAVQKSLERPVAIKELKKAFHADAQIVRRFERESRVAASLQHENIVHVYDFWKKPAFSIVMEYVGGTNLADVIEKTGALPVDVGVMIAIQVCSALDYAHMHGLVHRDIKPSNIMIKRNVEVKLMGFGNAQSRARATCRNPTGDASAGDHGAHDNRSPGRLLSNRHGSFRAVNVSRPLNAGH